MLSSTLLFFIALNFFSGVHADQALSIQLTGPTEVEDVDNFAVTSIVTNTGTEHVQLFKDPRSALDDFPSNTFTVTSDDGAPEFIGAYAKWSYKYSDDYVSLAPGESFKVTHQLGDAYQFNKAATYSITPHATFYAVPSGDNSAPVPIIASLPEEKHTAALSGSLVSTVVAKRLEEHADYLQKRSLEKRADYIGCVGNKKNVIAVAIINAITMYGSAISILNAKPDSARYRKWFGKYSKANRDLVFTHFKKVQSSNLGGYTYDCNCNRPGVFAWVYANTYPKINLCPAFWSAPATGTDSRAGTLIHESTHFTRNGGTEDDKYGQPLCAALAITSPSRAIMNADSHEFFAENTPYLN